MRVLRQPTVLAKCGFSSMTLYRKQRDGSFPMRLRLGPNSVGWLEEEVDIWLAARAAERAQKPSHNNEDTSAQKEEPAQ